MKRSKCFAVLLIACLMSILPLPAEAAEPGGEQRELEALVGDIEALIGVLDGEARPTLREHGGGLWSVTIPLSEESLERIRAADRRPARAADFQILAVGHSKQTPRRLTKLISTPLSNLTARYNFWWVVVNFNEDVKTANTNRRLRGPGTVFNETSPVDYAALAISAFWTQAEPLEEFGVYTFTVKVTGAGRGKTAFLAQ